MILSHCDQTGMTTHTLDLSTALVELGHEVTLLVGRSTIASRASDTMLTRFVRGGIKVVTFHDYYDRHVVYKAISAIEMELYLMMHKFDVIHVQSPYLSFIPWLQHKKFVSTLHVNDLVPCFYYKNASHLIAISKETKEYAKHVFGYKDSEITIINHGVSMSFARRLNQDQKTVEKNRLGLPLNKIIIGLVGSIEKRKGHDLLLESLAALPRDLQDKFHIVLVGSSKDGKTNEWLLKLIEKTNMSEHVTHFEYQNPEVFYKLMDIFVLPSRLEGFGLVVVEAMLSGCCCVRSNVEGAYEQIDDGISGYIFENENVNQLTSILHNLLIHPDLRKKVAEAGREKALRCFTSKVMALNTVKVYDAVINMN